MIWWLTLGHHPIFLIKRLSVFIAAEFHLFELSGLPPVHFEGADKSNMHAHASVVSCALVAKENSNRRTAPLGVFRPAVKTDLKIRD